MGRKDIALQIFFFSFFNLTLNIICKGQFYFKGSASNLGNNSFQITNDLPQQSGAVWNIERINLNNPFNLEFKLFAGCKDSMGADGLVFVLQSIGLEAGGTGGGMGFDGLDSSIGIEFDTWRNTKYKDPVYDHIYIIKNGNVDHNNSSTGEGPIQASATSPNIEDCMDHLVKISWNPLLMKLEVYFDCELRISYSIDLINEIFYGDPYVYWGFTAATGGRSNEQKITMIPDITISKDAAICAGDFINLKVTGGIACEWSPAGEFKDPFKSEQMVTPSRSVEYTVMVTENCNKITEKTVKIIVNENPIARFIKTPLTADSLSPSFQFTDASIGASTGLWEFGQNGNGDTAYYPGAVVMHNYEDLDEGLGGEYLVGLTVENSLGCKDAFFEKIYLSPYFSFYVPNAFTPNNDGINDYFFIESTGILELEFFIFNRWGKMIYYTTDKNAKWDGQTGKGIMAEDEAYIWKARYLNVFNRRFNETGKVILLK